MSTRATPFHPRAAAANTDNLWINRNGWTLSSIYSNTADEALAARVSVVMADITWRWRVMLDGANAATFLSRLTTKPAETLAPGTAHKALWLNDAGGVRGAGAIARYGRESFLLAAAAPDKEWIECAAARFDVAARETADGGVALIGPYAKAVLDAAGLDVTLEPLAFRKLFWRGLDVTVSRWGEHGGYELWCNADDGVVVWDRLMKAGAAFGILPAGTDAMDLLDMEAGVPRPLRDWRPAADGTSPSPRELGFEKLIAEDHRVFNGWAASLEQQAPMRLVGVTLESEEPVQNGAILYQAKPVGRLVTNLYSPALKRVIGWARLEEGVSSIGSTVTLRAETDITVAVVDLPFLTAPAPIDA